jgi:hypothetical protein
MCDLPSGPPAASIATKPSGPGFIGLDESIPVPGSIPTPTAQLLSRVVDWLHDSRMPSPRLVTVARSADDGYTPEGVVTELEKQVLSMVRQLT